eukprot:scaffold51975_cov51-Phaeocystis_antarctica.AAC.1
MAGATAHASQRTSLTPTNLGFVAVWLACVTSGSAAPSSLTATADADVPSSSDKTMVLVRHPAQPSI